MNTEKPPVARMRAGGFSRLYKFLLPALLAAAIQVFPASPAESAMGYSLGLPVYYMRTPKDFLPIVSGWCFTAVWDDGNTNKGMHFEMLKFDDYGYVVDSINIGVVLEKPVGRALVGVGMGLLDSRFAPPTPGMKSFIADVYGKVTILSLGRGSLRGFMTARWLEPTPFTSRTIYNGGLEVSLNLR